MPLLLNKQIDTVSAYAVWNIQETFATIPELAPEPIPDNLNPVRRAEWIIGRILVKSLAEKFGLEYRGIGKHATGKPYLIDWDVHIAISHSFPIAAAMIHLERPCGIDMERPRQKHATVQHKYLHQSELEYQNDIKRLCAIWCAKEVIYKIFGRRFLSLKDDIQVTFEGENLMRGQVLKKGHEEIHMIPFGWVKEYILAYGT